MQFSISVHLIFFSLILVITMLSPVAIKNGICPHSCCSSALVYLATHSSNVKRAKRLDAPIKILRAHEGKKRRLWQHWFLSRILTMVKLKYWSALQKVKMKGLRMCDCVTYLANAARKVLLNIVQMMGLIMDEAYPSHKATSTTCVGTGIGHCGRGQKAKKIFNKKNGAQHRTKVKNTKPKTLLAFCSVRTAFVTVVTFCLRFRLGKNLKKKKKIEIFQTRSR